MEFDSASGCILPTASPSRSTSLASAKIRERICLYHQEVEIGLGLLRDLSNSAASLSRSAAPLSLRSLQWLDCAISINEVVGFLSPEQGIILRTLAECGEGHGEIVEIGSFMGRSTVWLAKGAKASKRELVTAIDPHTGSEEHRAGGEFSHLMPPEGTTLRKFLENISRFEVSDWITPLITTSREAARAWERPVRLLFVDGDHSYDSVREDLLLWEQYVIPGGYIAIHDVFSNGAGPEQAVRDIISSSQRFYNVVYAHGLYVVQKVR